MSSRCAAPLRIPWGPTRALSLGLSVTLGLALVSCGTPTERPSAAAGTWSGRPIGSPPPPNPALKHMIIQRANREWQQFDRQVVVFKGTEESIPHVGAWEDDYTHASRVNLYWRAVDKPRLDGMDCQQPWSAAFMTWVMQGAGIPASQFRPAAAHWVYLSTMIDEASYPGRYFVPRRVSDYSPGPGDLVCAYRGRSRLGTRDGFVSSGMLHGAETHCDLVVNKNGRTLEAVGGNVRNSVSKSVLELDDRGRLKPVPRRPWFLIMENRL
ncbi:MAG: DUF2272 domain-containing protein [Thiocapsa sp.]|nr:DUF2272 domain-containing protein [Thiocapsa sp.]MCG6897041.1 DUF2272 domain-containing protein [Thiocapsa sp.]